ncbi:MAG: glycosyltransferase family 2 protein, partial [Planctomycetota bacterium]
MKISVVIPAYNAERTIGRAIDSVLAQTRAADEVIVVDDGSTDGTADVVRGYGEKVMLIQQENAGVSVARNKGIEAATSDWIAFLDSDDEWLPEKLKLQSNHLQRHPDLKWTYGNFYKKQGYLQQIPAHVSPGLSSFLNDEVFDDYLTAYANYGYAWTGTLMIQRDVFGVVGAFEPGMKRAQDTDLWFRIAYQFPQIGYVSEPLAIYHLDT